MSTRKRTEENSKETKKLKKNSSESESESESDLSSDGDDEIDQICIDFSGFELAPEDFSGIQLLLTQLFLKNHLDLNGLTNFIIDGQPDIGLVIKESEIDEPSGSSDNANEDDTVYGLVTAINLSNNKELKFVSQLKNLLLELSKQHATEKTNDFISSLFNEPSNSIGFLINERYSNLPPAISVPSLSRLKCELDKKSSEDSSYKFTHFIVMSKLYKVPTKKKKQSSKDYDIIWSNAEDEIIDKEADARFEFSVANESDSALGGSWTEDDIELLPFRRVLVFAAHKLDSILKEATELSK